MKNTYIPKAKTFPNRAPLRDARVNIRAALSHLDEIDRMMTKTEERAEHLRSQAVMFQNRTASLRRYIRALEAEVVEHFANPGRECIRRAQGKVTGGADDAT